MFSFRLAELHPVVVHFPIALLIASVALDFAGIALRRAGLTTAATWCLVLGVPGAFAALFSGWLSERDISLALAGSLLHIHKVFAVVTSLSFSLLLLVRLLWLLPAILQWISCSFIRSEVVIGRLDTRLQVWLPALYLKPLPRLVVALYLLASVVSVVLLGLTGYLGGTLVYDQGVAQPLR
jgi:uncharacterized membrane protein